MFNLPIEDRLSSWAGHRAQLENIENPLDATLYFWKTAPFIPYNKNIEQYNQPSWPTPWEIIIENKYDDFTRALMIAYSIKYTQRFKNSTVEIRTLVDNARNSCYNVVCVDNEWALNYNDNSAVPITVIPETLLLENIIEVGLPR